MNGLPVLVSPIADTTYTLPLISGHFIPAQHLQCDGESSTHITLSPFFIFVVRGLTRRRSESGGRWPLVNPCASFPPLRLALRSGLFPAFDLMHSNDFTGSQPRQPLGFRSHHFTVATEDRA